MSGQPWKKVLALGMAINVVSCAKVSVEPARHGSHALPATHHSLAHGPTRHSTTLTASLAAIVNNDLQNGRYEEGGRALRRYVQTHPGDQQAASYLRQLTEDPKSMLGVSSSPYVVKTGESYSTLAGRYLGDPNLFVALARYNHANNPSLIRAGSTVQIPSLHAPLVDAAHTHPKGSRTGTSTVPASASTFTSAEDLAIPISLVANPPPANSTAQRAEQLKEQSIGLYRNGHKEQALDVLNQALLLNPKLSSTDPAFTTLRQNWITDQHQQAMVLYLDQQLDQAIALWNRLLTVDPGYEPAVVYRLHALELQQRMKSY